MSSTSCLCTALRSTAALLTVLTLTADPAFAQRRHPEGGERGGGRQAGENRPSARDNGSARRQAQPRREPREQRRRAEADTRRAERPRADRPRDIRGRDGRGRDDGRAEVRRRDERRAVPRYDGRRNDRTIIVRPRVVVPQYRYRAYPRRSYVVPYGYRPYGYRPGWSFDLYFGRPYGGGYYANRPYGYYALTPGLVYGSLRIVDAPRDARVFVDGYYAGAVDDYDGVFQRLNLEPGPHHIEIEIHPDVEPIAFEVRIEPGQTVTFHARDYY